MLFNLCDLGPDREEEKQTLKYAFINQHNPPKDVEQAINNYQESEGNEENKTGKKMGKRKILFTKYPEGLQTELHW